MLDACVVNRSGVVLVVESRSTSHLLPDDRLVAVDGAELGDLPLSRLVQAARGEGVPHWLTVEREGVRTLLYWCRSDDPGQVCGPAGTPPPAVAATLTQGTGP